MTDAAQTEHSLKKQYLLASFFTKYQAVVDFVQNLEIHPQFKLNTITRLDEAMFWAREAIINIPAPEAVEPPAPTAPEVPLESPPLE
jgi:hypothetical protein